MAAVVLFALFLILNRPNPLDAVITTGNYEELKEKIRKTSSKEDYEKVRKILDYAETIERMGILGEKVLFSLDNLRRQTAGLKKTNATITEYEKAALFKTTAVELLSGHRFRDLIKDQKQSEKAVSEKYRELTKKKEAAIKAK